MKSAAHTHEGRPRKDRRGFDLISDQPPLGRLWFSRQLHNNQEPHGGIGPSCGSLSFCRLLRSVESEGSQASLVAALNVEPSGNVSLRSVMSAVSPSRDVLQRLQVPNFDV